MLYFSTLLFSMFTTIALIPILRRYADRMNCLDEPCQRKVHCVPIPRVGGIAMAVGALMPVLFLASKSPRTLAILIGAAVIIVFGILDDVKELGYRSKFAAQIAAAMVAVFWGGLRISYLGDLLPNGLLLPGWAAVPLTLFVILAVTNAVNLADGLDGLAGGIMLMVFICLGVLAFQTEKFTIALLVLATVGAIFGFLRFNTYPATVFMGDAGSQLLGFLAITLSIGLSQGFTPLSPLFPLLLLGLPVLDTATVMGQRILRGQSPFMADKNHLHHKLLRFNLFHSEAVLVVYLLQATFVSSAYLLRYHSERLLLLCFSCFSLCMVILMAFAIGNGWHFDRPGYIDRIVKKRLKIHIKDQYLAIKVSHAMLEYGFMALMFVTFLLPGRITLPAELVAAASIFILGATWRFWPGQGVTVIRVLIYFFMPLVIYYGDLQTTGWIPHNLVTVYNLCFGVLVFFAVVTLKTTRRLKGYTATPMDFLILFVATVVPNLPETAVSSFHLGATAAKTIALFFVFEVLAGELRGDQLKLNLSMLVGLGVFSLVGFVGYWV